MFAIRKNAVRRRCNTAPSLARDSEGFGDTGIKIPRPSEPLFSVGKQLFVDQTGSLKLPELPSLPKGTLTPAEAEALQMIADQFGTSFDVIGSRASGAGRNIEDLSLPVGKPPGTGSDIDLRINGEHEIASGGRFSEALMQVGNGAGSSASQIGTSRAPYMRFVASGRWPVFVRSEQ